MVVPAARRTECMALAFIAFGLVVYAMYLAYCHRCRPRPRPRPGDCAEESYGYGSPPPGAAVEPYTPVSPETAVAPPPTPEPPRPPTTLSPADMAAALEFAEVLITPEERAAMAEVIEGAQQLKTPSQRLEEARRGRVEDSMRPGVKSNKERRQAMDNMLRRPNCTKRAHSWRMEFSDKLRGDPIPKTSSSWGFMRSGRSNPQADLHPGSLGVMSGREGRWLSEEIIPDNEITDPL